MSNKIGWMMAEIRPGEVCDKCKYDSTCDGFRFQRPAKTALSASITSEVILRKTELNGLICSPVSSSSFSTHQLIYLPLIPRAYLLE